jgi:hypothetical protein
MDRAEELVHEIEEDAPIDAYHSRGIYHSNDKSDAGS